MADALPNPPSAIAEAVSKYRTRLVGGAAKNVVRTAAGRDQAFLLAVEAILTGCVLTMMAALLCLDAGGRNKNRQHARPAHVDVSARSSCELSQCVRSSRVQSVCVLTDMPW